MYLSKNYGSTTMLTLNSQRSEIGFYFHSPFCPHICPYCDFIITNNIDNHYSNCKSCPIEINNFCIKAYKIIVYTSI